MPGKRKAEKGKQLALLDLTPENLMALEPVVAEYQDALANRLAWLKDELDHKKQILALVKDAGLRPNADGVIKFELGGSIVTITARDELISVRPPKEEKVKD